MSTPIRRRSLIAAGIAAAVVVVLGVTAWASLGLMWPEDVEDDSSGAPRATTTVATETLVDTVTTDGELSYGDEVQVVARSGGTITALADVGVVVERGRTLFRLDDRPVVLFFGDLPAYRDLGAGDTGADVRELEENLAALGYLDIEPDDYFGWGTTAAVEAWQHAIGVDETGTVSLGSIVFAPEALRIDAHDASVGDPVGPSAPVLTATGDRRVIVTELKVSQERLAEPETTVLLTLPNGTEVAGTVADRRTVVETDQDGESETRIQVTVAPEDEDPFREYDHASIDVAFTAGTREDVLTVPVAALLALVDGGYALEIVEGDTSRIVPVEVGLFANGRVEVSGDGLAVGTVVGVPST